MPDPRQSFSTVETIECDDDPKARRPNEKDRRLADAGVEMPYVERSSESYPVSRHRMRDLPRYPVQVIALGLTMTGQAESLPSVSQAVAGDLQVPHQDVEEKRATVLVEADALVPVWPAVAAFTFSVVAIVVAVLLWTPAYGAYAIALAFVSLLAAVVGVSHLYVRWHLRQQEHVPVS